MRRIRWRIIPCGGRKEAYESFCDALKNEPDVFHVLLVDAEELVVKTPWKHLKARQGDQWDQPAKTTDDHCHLMVVTMETWFLADPDAVKEFFKHTKGFDKDVLPEPPPLPTPPKLATVLEAMSKAKVNEILAKATRHTKDEQYEKIKHAAKLLAKIDSAKVRKQCPSCERLFRTVAGAMDTVV